MPGGIVIPQDCPLFDYYEEVKLEARKHLYPLEVRVESKEKSIELRDLKKLDLIQMAGQRLLYR